MRRRNTKDLRGLREDYTEATRGEDPSVVLPFDTIAADNRTLSLALMAFQNWASNEWIYSGPIDGNYNEDVEAVWLTYAPFAFDRPSTLGDVYHVYTQTKDSFDRSDADAILFRVAILRDRWIASVGARYFTMVEMPDNPTISGGRVDITLPIDEGRFSITDLGSTPGETADDGTRVTAGETAATDADIHVSAEEEDLSEPTSRGKWLGIGVIALGCLGVLGAVIWSRKNKAG